MITATTLAFTCFVPGVPLPQGSMKAFPFLDKEGKPRASMTCDNPSLKKWRKAMKEAFIWKLKELRMREFDCAVAIKYTFILPDKKPCAQAKSGLADVRPETAADLDKLIRACNDSLKDAGVLSNDSRVCKIDATKDVTFFSNDKPGVLVVVQPLTETSFL